MRAQSRTRENLEYATQKPRNPIVYAEKRGSESIIGEVLTTDFLLNLEENGTWQLSP